MSHIGGTTRRLFLLGLNLLAMLLSIEYFKLL